MDVYRTEEEQIEAIKKFFAEYGWKVVAAILVAVALYMGYHAWRHSQQTARDTASLYYDKLSESLKSSQDPTGEGRKQFDEAYAKLLEEYPSSIYASYAALHKARLDMLKPDLDAARKSLEWVVGAAVNANVTALARLRLARVEFAAGKTDRALELLSQEAGPYAADYAELKGDILVSGNKLPEALVEYKKALTSGGEAGKGTNKLLEMKIEDLSGADESKLYPVPAGTAQ